jgi:hypothetical protein
MLGCSWILSACSLQNDNAKMSSWSKAKPPQSVILSVVEGSKNERIVILEQGEAAAECLPERSRRI